MPGSWHSDLAYGSLPPASQPASKPTEPTRSGTLDPSALRPLAPPPPPRRQASSSTLSFSSSARRPRDSAAWSDDGLPSSPGDGFGKKELLWQQRLQKARAVMDRHGVTLRTWRVGSDVADVCVRLAEMEIREMEWERKKVERWEREGRK